MANLLRPYWHCYPIGDLREHDTENGINCWCHPAEDEGMIIHNAMDNREAYETGEKQLH